MNIRVLTKENADIYLQLCIEGLTQNPEAFGSSYEDIMKQENPVEAIAKRLDNPEKFTIGAFHEEELIGIATLEIKPLVKQEHKAKIGSVYVSPKARGLGAGRALIETIIENAPRLDIEQIMLNVVSGNKPAKKLYESLGFQTFGVEERALKYNGQYWDEEHMMLFLNA